MGASGSAMLIMPTAPASPRFGQVAVGSARPSGPPPGARLQPGVRARLYHAAELNGHDPGQPGLHIGRAGA